MLSRLDASGDERPLECGDTGLWTLRAASRHRGGASLAGHGAVSLWKSDATRGFMGRCGGGKGGERLRGCVLVSPDSRSSGGGGSRHEDLSTRNCRKGGKLEGFSTGFSTGTMGGWYREIPFCRAFCPFGVTDGPRKRPLRSTDVFQDGDVGEGWCRGPDSNWGHRPFQGRALPTELPRRTGGDDRI